MKIKRSRGKDICGVIDVCSSIKLFDLFFNSAIINNAAVVEYIFKKPSEIRVCNFS